MLDFLDIYKKLDFLPEYLRVQYTNFIIKYFHKVEYRLTLEEIFVRLKADEPIEYIFNLAEFGECQLYVDNRVLIPRQETLELAKLSLEYIASQDNVRCVLDIGTGSGCIAIYLADQLRDRDISFYGIDISKDALDVANINITEYKLQNKIKLIHTDFRDLEFENLSDCMIVANLPYIPNSRKLPNSVYKYEPHIALFGGMNGDELITELLNKIKKSENIKRSFLEIDNGEIIVI
ncbi:MAG: HemK family protein methyltransferase [Candidatus Dojkabacteria bacterium]|nr:HemK family protein methyltransferase [Candidatus Dojkabacteria bacterium]